MKFLKNLMKNYFSQKLQIQVNKISNIFNYTNNNNNYSYS